jgi:hypothetical protein
MTPKFDKLVEELLAEAAKCTHETLPQLSEHPDFRWKRCVRNPYSSGFKTLHFGRKDGSFDYSICNKPHRPGTEKAETCSMVKKIMRRRKLLALKRKLENSGN